MRVLVMVGNKVALSLVSSGALLLLVLLHGLERTAAFCSFEVAIHI
jgi:hypothetical protein